jgi:hypothetical protein
VWADRAGLQNATSRIPANCEGHVVDVLGAAPRRTNPTTRYRRRQCSCARGGGAQGDGAPGGVGSEPPVEVEQELELELELARNPETGENRY